MIEQPDRLREASARLVMGWHAVRIPWAYNGAAECWENAEDIPVMTCHAWRPDEDDAQCMKVLEQMVERGYVCSMVVESTRVRVAFGSEDSLPPPIEHPNRRIGLLQAALAALSI